MKLFNLKSYFTFLSRNKAYTAVNVFGLAVSLTFVMIIGLYTWQEFSINYQHGKAKRIYNIGLRFQDSINIANCHHAVLRYMRSRYPEIEKTCGFTTQVIKVTDNDDFVNMKALASDSTFFDMFDFKLLRGDRATCLMQKNNVVLTQKFARKFFGTDDVLGRVLATTEHGKFRVTGVVADFDNTIIDKDIEAIVDFSHTRNMADKDEYFPSMVNVTGSSSFVQVREGCDFAAKQADVAEYFKKFWGAAYPPVLTRLDNLYFSGAESWQALRLGNFTLVKILLAVGIVILLFSIMNYVNLTVAQSGYRAREMATRRLFGCNKGDVGMNMFAESLVMCFISCLLALLLTAVCAPYAGRLLDTEIDVSLLFNPLAICVIVVFILLVSFLSGVFPASILSRVNPIEVVRGTFRKQTKMFFSRVFITLQNVITIVMLACALIMSLQMRHLVKAPLGINTENIIALSVSDVSGGRYTAEFIDKLRALPFVKGVAPSYGTPANGGNNHTVTFDGEKQQWMFQFICGTPEMLKIYGVTLKTDNHVEGDSIIYLNEMAMNGLQMKLTDTHMNNRYKRARFDYFSENGRFGGVVNDFQIRNILAGKYPMIIQVCNNIKSPWEVSILVEGDIMDAYAQIKDIYKKVYHEEVNESRPVFVDKLVEWMFEKEIRASKIVTLFAIVAIVISLLGLVAMSTYFIQQRAKEIAVRKVFGSTGSQVRRQLVRTFLIHVGIAFVVAVPVVVYFISGWISQYSYRITWWPWIVVAGLIVLLISFAAVAVQSWVAASENPVKNIKQE